MGEPLRGKKLWLARSISVLVKSESCPNRPLRRDMSLLMSELDVNCAVDVTQRVDQVPVQMDPCP
jgi:hypothetical protein